MNHADEIVLKTLQPHMTDYGYAYVVEQVEKAGSIRNLTDVVASMELQMAKRKFGNRSAAGQYAAQVRWSGKRPEMLLPEGGVSYRSAMVGGKDIQFKIAESTAGSVSSGQIISTGANRVPERVIGIKSQGDRLLITTQKLDSTTRAQTDIAANAKVKVWTSQDGSLEVNKAKQSFGGNRSAAGAYAARVRWGAGGNDSSGGSTSGTVAGGGGSPSEGDAVADKYDPDKRMKPVEDILSQNPLPSDSRKDIQIIKKSLHEVNYQSERINKHRAALATSVTGVADTMLEVSIQKRAEHIGLISKAVQRIGWRATNKAKGAAMSENPEWRAQGLKTAGALREIHTVLKGILADFKNNDLHNPKA